MFGSVFDKVAGYLGIRTVLGFLLPMIAFVSVALLLVGADVGWATVETWWIKRDGAFKGLAIVGTVAATAFAAMTMAQFVMPLVRLYEGYWTGPIGQRLAILYRKRMLRRLSSLDPEKDGNFELRYYRYPVDRDDVLPTRLGNVFRSAETYPSAEGRYGMDAVFFWPRLLPVVPDSMRALLAEARSSINTLIATSFLASVFSLAFLCFFLVRPGFPLVWLMGAVGGLVISRISYLGAVSAATTYAELVRVSFDLYRHDLLKQLGFARPRSLTDEQLLWRNIAAQLYRRLAPNPEVLEYGGD